jgi:predicted DsbA family dithiol-disulfide isomerase
MAHLDIWSDIACPWCFIGKRRLERALATLPAAERPTVRWHAYQLMPDFPPGESTPARAMLERKFGGAARVAAMLDHVRGIAAAVGITFDVDRQRACNTALAHRATAVARQYGREDAAVEAFFRAYFEEGRDLADETVVLDILASVVAGDAAGDAAVDRSALQQRLSSAEIVAEVEHDKQEARLVGVQGVPFFVLDERLALSGAQEPATFVAFLREGRPAH